MVVRRAGGVRQSSPRVPHRRGRARAAAADGLPGRLLRLAHHDRCRAARLGAGEGIPAAVQAPLPARSAASGVARAADHAGAGAAAAARTRGRDGRREDGGRGGARRRRGHLRAALYESDTRPLVLSFMAGMGGEAIVLKEFYWMTNKLLEAQKRGKIEKRTHWVGFEE